MAETISGKIFQLWILLIFVCTAGFVIIPTLFTKPSSSLSDIRPMGDILDGRITETLLGKYMNDTDLDTIIKSTTKSIDSHTTTSPKQQDLKNNTQGLHLKKLSFISNMLSLFGGLKMPSEDKQTHLSSQ